MVGARKELLWPIGMTSESWNKPVPQESFIKITHPSTALQLAFIFRPITRANLACYAQSNASLALPGPWVCRQQVRHAQCKRTFLQCWKGKSMRLSNVHTSLPCTSAATKRGTGSCQHSTKRVPASAMTNIGQLSNKACNHYNHWPFKYIQPTSPTGRQVPEGLSSTSTDHLIRSGAAP